MFRPFSRTVSVAFVDDATGRQVAASDVPLDQLPDTFALDTELDIGGSRYFVVRAEPQTKAEFAKTRRLMVALRRVEKVGTRAEQKILFSLPSICGAALPSATGASISGDVVVLHEDDSRQCEFVASRQRGHFGGTGRNSTNPCNRCGGSRLARDPRARANHTSAPGRHHVDHGHRASRSVRTRRRRCLR